MYYLYREFESMPAVTDSITPQIRTDILAYVLRQNGYPAGKTELKFDLAAMKLMPLDEDTRVLPGHGPTTTIGEERESNPFVDPGRL